MHRVLDGEDICHTSGIKWISYHSQSIYSDAQSPKKYRAAVVAYGVLELKRQLAQLIKMIEEKPHEAFSFDAAGLYYGFGEPEGRMAFIFPGQGAQYVRMGEPLSEIYPQMRAVWENLGSFAFNGKTINEVVFPPKARDQKEASFQADHLSRTDWSMPAINLMSESIRVMFASMFVKPDAIASHSAGDAASYCAAGIISSEQMIRFAGFRGVHAAACPMASQGGILMVFAEPKKIRGLLKKHNIKEVWIANHNSPAVTVLSGKRENMKEAKQILAEASIKSKLIPISAAPHCPLSLRASNQFMDYIAEEEFRKSDCDFYSYLFGNKLANDPALYKKVISVSCLKPVRFVDQINQMHADGVRTFVEIGPSDGLTMFVRRILDGKPHQAICTNKQSGDANYHFLSAVAELIKLGRVKDTSVLWEMYKTPLRPAVLGADFPKETSEMTGAMLSAEMDRLKTLDLQLSKINKMASA
ncbi:MAG: ACP S-malonyltransferase [Desulfobacteraceae bacterium]|nr:ACP S-malonyltransferase [Desulfobacteraceae bacterium]